MNYATRNYPRGDVNIWTVIAVLGFLVMLVLVLWPNTTRDHRMANSSLCSANLRSIMQALNVYASDNSDAYPLVSAKGGYSLAAGGTGTPQAKGDDTIHSMYTTPDTPSVVQNMWLLVLTGQVAPKQFICRSDPSRTVSASATSKGNLYLPNFNDGKVAPSDFSYSYSFAYPWEATEEAKVGSWWKNTADANLPLASDMVPLNGTGTPKATPADPTRETANSFNHERRGQNIGFGDAHAEFYRTPVVQGATPKRVDNIFTFNHGIPSKTGTPTNGTIPDIGTGGTPGNYDICLVPAADGATFARK